MAVRHVSGPQVLNPIDEVPWMETDHASRWSLNLIKLTGLAGRHAPAELPAPWLSRK